ncbi:MAG TPA: serine/threonine-protein kinase [Polyangiaceae bacterium]|nr:serine/threonine-protein kinase [Polyangiaceae bacterium]
MQRPPAPNSDPPSSFLPGTVIDGKFEVRRLLGVGAMGAVVEATHLLRRARVALKFMSEAVAHSPGVVERFLNEGIAASRINNEHVVRVLDVSRLPNGQPYLVMEFLEGEDLQSLLQREGRQGLPDVARAVHLVLQVLRGLQVAHHAGIIHRDLKPANCFVVTEDGEPDFVKIVDFGISKVQQGDGTLKLTTEGASMGTPLYVSPEQARDAMNVDARSDIYSVSAMLYELLCGRTPFEATTLMGLFMQLATTMPEPVGARRPNLPAGLSEVVQRGLAKQPSERFQSAAEMAQALAPYADARSEGLLLKLAQRPSLSASRPSSRPPSRAGGSAVSVGDRTQRSKGIGSQPPHSPSSNALTMDAPAAAPSRARVRLVLGSLAVVLLAAAAAAGLRWFKSSAETTPAASATSSPSSSAAPESAPRSGQPTVIPVPSVEVSAQVQASGSSSATMPGGTGPSAPPPIRAKSDPSVSASGKNGSTGAETVRPKGPRPSLGKIGVQD